MAITLVKGHEPTPYEAPECYCWSFLEFYYVNMKGPNKQLNSILKAINKLRRLKGDFEGL